MTFGFPLKGVRSLDTGESYTHCPSNPSVFKAAFLFTDGGSGQAGALLPNPMWMVPEGSQQSLAFKAPSGCSGQATPIYWLLLSDLILLSFLSQILGFLILRPKTVLPLSFLLGFMAMLAFLPQL